MGVLPSLDQPRRHVVERATGPTEVRDSPHLSALGLALELRAPEGRIAEHERALLWWQRFGPVHFQCVAVDDVRGSLKRNPRVRLPELQAQPVVHDVVHHPHRRLRDADGKLADLDPVELVHVHDRQCLGKCVKLLLGMDRLQDLDLKLRASRGKR